MPRGLEFLFSRNRLNVAISRAKALAVLVCSPRLLETRCRTVDQMRLVNGLCRSSSIPHAPAYQSLTLGLPSRLDLRNDDAANGTRGRSVTAPGRRASASMTSPVTVSC